MNSHGLLLLCLWKYILCIIIWWYLLFSIADYNLGLTLSFQKNNNKFILRGLTSDGNHIAVNNSRRWIYILYKIRQFHVQTWSVSHILSGCLKSVRQGSCDVVHWWYHRETLTIEVTELVPFQTSRLFVSFMPDINFIIHSLRVSLELSFKKYGDFP